jgi:hypothetical protein
MLERSGGFIRRTGRAIEEPQPLGISDNRPSGDSGRDYAPSSHTSPLFFCRSKRSLPQGIAAESDEPSLGRAVTAQAAVTAQDALNSRKLRIPALEMMVPAFGLEQKLQLLHLKDILHNPLI